MDRVTKIKEAFKTGLALMLVYGIALKVNWMNPYWAAWPVAMIALSTAGESIHKGMLRLAFITIDLRVKVDDGTID